MKYSAYSDVVSVTTQIPFQSDLAFYTKERSGLTLIDETADNDASILVSEFYKVNATDKIYGDKTRSSEKILDGNSYTIYFAFHAFETVEDGVTKDFIRLGGGTTTASKGIYIRIENKMMRTYIADGSAYIRTYMHANDAGDAGYLNKNCDFLISVNGTTKTVIFTIYNHLTDAVVFTKTVDASSLTFNINENTTYYEIMPKFAIITNFKKYQGVVFLANAKSDTYTTGLQIHIPHVLSGLDISGNNQYFHRLITSTKYKSLHQYMINKGYDEYYHPVNELNMYYPHDKNGDGIDLIWTGSGQSYSGMRMIKEAEGYTEKFNMIPDSKVRFSHSFFDRSNETIWNDTCRASDYYDSDNTKDFHVSELNQRILMSYLNDGYRGKLYVKVIDNSVITGQGGYSSLKEGYKLDSVILYSTDKKGSDNKNVLTYTGDIFSAVLDEGEVSYDTDGYVKLGVLKTNKPMFTIRIDDGYESAYTTMRSVLNGLNVKGSVNIHSELVGTTNGYTFMTWAQINTLISEGWEITSSGMYDNDWSDSDNFRLAETELMTSKQNIEAQGITCNHVIPNRHGISNPAVRYFAKKHGFLTCHAGNYYGSVHGTNPQAIDLFNLCAMSIDLEIDPEVDYYLDKADASTAIANLKAQLDLCVSQNRWAILYMHAPSANLITNLTEVIQYAIAQGITNVTMDEALENTEYL